MYQFSNARMLFEQDTFWISGYSGLLYFPVNQMEKEEHIVSEKKSNEMMLITDRWWDFNWSLDHLTVFSICWKILIHHCTLSSSGLHFLNSLSLYLDPLSSCFDSSICSSYLSDTRDPSRDQMSFPWCFHRDDMSFLILLWFFRRTNPLVLVPVTCIKWSVIWLH